MAQSVVYVGQQISGAGFRIMKCNLTFERLDRSVQFESGRAWIGVHRHFRAHQIGIGIAVVVEAGATRCIHGNALRYERRVQADSGSVHPATKHGHHEYFLLVRQKTLHGQDRTRSGHAKHKQHKESRRNPARIHAEARI